MSNLKRVFLGAVGLVALGAAAPAFAANVGLTIWNTNDVGGAVSATGTDNVVIGNENLNGVTVDGSFGTRSTSPNEINGAQFLITNTTGTSQTIELAVGGIGYVGPDGQYLQSATINLQNGSADLAGGYFIDALDRFSGTSAATPFGIENAMFDSGPLTGPEAFSFNNTALSPNSGPLFSMGETLTVTLGAGATVGVQGISMDASAVPEPQTWALMGIGFALMAFLGLRQRKTARYAI